MGAWGPGLFEDDLAEDLRADFEELLEAGTPPPAAAEELLAAYRESLEDPDERPVVVLALAWLLRHAGVADHPLIQEARHLLEAGEGLEPWREAGPEALGAREAVYRELLEYLSPSGGA